MFDQEVKAKTTHMEKRRINISSNRQITIPAKYYDELGLSKELDCIYSRGMLILTPVKKDDPAFSEEILTDLINKGYSGERLLSEFKRISRQIRPAIEDISENYIDPTDSIFGTDDSED